MKRKNYLSLLAGIQRLKLSLRKKDYPAIAKAGLKVVSFFGGIANDLILKKKP